jgi:hypothetical protein
VALIAAGPEDVPSASGFTIIANLTVGEAALRVQPAV